MHPIYWSRHNFYFGLWSYSYFPNDDAEDSITYLVSILLLVLFRYILHNKVNIFYVFVYLDGIP